jgi:magnesium transporter
MIVAYTASGDRLKPLESFKEINQSADIAWIDLVSPTAEEDRMVEEFLQISIPTKEDMQEIELSARLYDEDGADYLTMVAVAHMTLDDPVKAPVTFIVHQNTLVTVRYSELTALNDYVQKAKKKNGVTIPAPTALMTDMLESFVNRAADSLEALGAEIEGISRDIFRSKGVSVKRKTGMLQSAIRKIGEKGDLLSMIRESLSTMSRLLYHCNEHKAEVANKQLRAKMATLGRDISSLNDHAGFLSGKMNFLLDATLGMINLEQNQIIKIFSIAAVVFLPPTLVASIYGMNFKFMPELDSLYGYPVAITMMIVSAIIPLAYFKKKGWL